ncbi:ANTAR domain-containing protein [Arthrobacter sp. NamB2]|uniref:PAS and ANTAR domain-containing protein n=1 Tax=Arthrobacter sp. NamB2 TaxID=2576035 RepID=UPI0010C97658|nr:PAS and ANTAR domain-containing protein [Arthrobacter sp. NamB2]TKV26929.1 ANTAR domain-containing protein [Arthrobacter sp. NamB2]
MPAVEALPAATIEHFVNCPTGIVEHYFESPALHWSDELYRIHGYERGEIVPTLDLGISHFEPTDQDAARSLWESLLSQGGPLSAYLSLRDVHGKVRKVLISGDYILTAGKDSSEPIGVWALVVDLTRSIQADTHRIANEAVAASAVKRSVIEQAKGIVMGRGGLTASEAFDWISHRSQATNRKVIAISQDIIDRSHQLNEESRPHLRAQALRDLFPMT